MLIAAVGNASRGGEAGPRIFFPLLLLLLLGLLIGKVIRRRRGIGAGGHRHGSPIQTLEDRFARGEIDRAEFEHRKAVLVGSEQIPPAPERPSPARGASVDPAESAGPVDTLEPDDEQ